MTSLHYFALPYEIVSRQVIWTLLLQFTDNSLTADMLQRCSIRRDIDHRKAFYILESPRFSQNLINNVHACPIVLHPVMRGFSSNCSRIPATLVLVLGHATASSSTPSTFWVTEYKSSIEEYHDGYYGTFIPKVLNLWVVNS